LFVGWFDNSCSSIVVMVEIMAAKGAGYGYIDVWVRCCILGVEAQPGRLSPYTSAGLTICPAHSYQSYGTDTVRMRTIVLFLERDRRNLVRQDQSPSCNGRVCKPPFPLCAHKRAELEIPVRLLGVATHY
jgi:hypothetical protein